MNNLSLDAKIESILFFKGEPVKISKLAEILAKNNSEILSALEILKEKLENRGLSLIFKEDQVVLVTNPTMSEIIQSLQKEELSKELSKAALETLSIIIYRGPIKRSEIDYIRGVNSQFSIRVLMIRGLIEKKVNPKDERSYFYSPSIELLSYLGLSNINEIPEYKKVNEDIENFINAEENSDENKN